MQGGWNTYSGGLQREDDKGQNEKAGGGLVNSRDLGWGTNVHITHLEQKVKTHEASKSSNRCFKQMGKQKKRHKTVLQAHFSNEEEYYNLLKKRTTV